jgi:hypothetical protein
MALTEDKVGYKRQAPRVQREEFYYKIKLASV